MARVVHLTTVHSARDPRILYKECVSLQGAGYDVALVAQHERDEVVEGVPAKALPIIYGRFRRLGLARQAYRVTRDLRPDLVHFHDPELIPVAKRLKRATGARVIYDMHEDYAAHGRLKGRIVRALERWCFKWVDHVVVANEAHRQIVPGENVTVIPNYAVSTGVEVRQRTYAGDRPLRLIYSGVVSEERGLNEILGLAEHAARRGLSVETVLVGVCHIRRQREVADDRIRSLGLRSPALQITGWEQYVPWPDILEQHHRADVGLVLWRPVRDHLTKIPTKFYEYLQAGLPIVCSDTPLWSDFVKRHECGAVVDPRDTGQILDLIQGWMDRPAAYATLSAAAARASRAYTWEKAEERLLALYESLLLRGRSQ